MDMQEHVKEYVESHLVRGAWIEIYLGRRHTHREGSHLVRGAWIEMLMITGQTPLTMGRTS